MCLAIPVEIIELRGNKALSRIMGAETEISIELLNDVAVGDFVILHAGCAISKVDKQEAEMTLELFREIEALGDMKAKK
jgi:hydrogenase expression/formation protein HypC